MTPEAQRIAIAEACGFTNVHRFQKWKEGGTMTDGTLVGDIGGRTRVYVPNYTSDLNAMHEAEEVLVGDQRINFLDNLLDVLGLNLGPGGWDMDFDSVWQMTRSTATQRAEAFLKTIGKWVP